MIFPWYSQYIPWCHPGRCVCEAGQRSAGSASRASRASRATAPWRPRKVMKRVPSGNLLQFAIENGDFPYVSLPEGIIFGILTYWGQIVSNSQYINMMTSQGIGQYFRFGITICLNSLNWCQIWLNWHISEYCSLSSFSWKCSLVYQTLAGAQQRLQCRLQEWFAKQHEFQGGSGALSKLGLRMW